MLFEERLLVSLRRAVLSAVIFTGLLAVSQFSAFAAGSVTLMWNPSTDSDVAGYRIYYGVASRNYTNIVDVGNATSVTISNLVEGVTYYFAATAYTLLGMESGYSDEATATVSGSRLSAPGNLRTSLTP